MRRRLLSGFLVMLLLIETWTPQVYAAEISSQGSEVITETSPSPEEEATVSPSAETEGEETASPEEAVESAVPEVSITPSATVEPEATEEPEAIETPEATETTEFEEEVEAAVVPSTLPEKTDLGVQQEIELERAVNSDPWCWPAPGNTTISQNFSSSHKAIDITGYYGAPIVAAKSGTVRVAINDCDHVLLDPETQRGVCNHQTYYYDGGNQVYIVHDDGTHSVYAHMIKGSVEVVAGQRVEAGQQIGKMGQSGLATGVHLHFGVSIGGDRYYAGTIVDPMTQLYNNESTPISLLTNTGVTDITDNTAKINSILPKVYYISEAGFYYGTSPDNMTKVVEPVSGNVRSVYYTLGNGKWCAALKPGTTYYYKIYAVINGVTHMTSVDSFTTTGTSTPTVSQIDINCNKPEGNLIRGDYFTIAGTAKSNVKLKNITVIVSSADGKAVKFSKSISLDDFSYQWGAYSELDNAMKFSTLEEGSYSFLLSVTDESGASKSVNSSFTIVAKQNQGNVEKPSLSLQTDKNYVDETSVCRTALITNPGKVKISEAGMVLYDSRHNIIAKCSENLNHYDSKLWLYYATNSRTSVNLNINLIPGTTYYYDIYAFIGNEKYTVSGEFETKGSSKPQTPTLKIDQTVYAKGDVVTVNWNKVDYAEKGYEITLYEMNGSYCKVVDTNMTSASFVLPEAGEYSISIVAKGYYNSDVGCLNKTIKVYDDCQVTFIEEAPDGTQQILKQETVKYMRNATAPPAPTRTGWVFQGWDKSYMSVTEDMVIKAIFKRNTYRVKFVDSKGKILKDEQVPYEGYLEPPEDPTPDAGYLFVGWDSDKYKYVTENTVITASYVYENDDLPLQLSVKSCEFDSDCTGYTVYYDVSNYDKKFTSGRAIVSLMTEDGRLVYTTESNAFTLKTSQLKSNVEVFVPYAGEAAYAEVVIVASFKSSIPLSEKKRVDVVRVWSSWKEEEPSESATEVESRTEYRYSDKVTTVSSSPNLTGWENCTAEGYWGDYGAWSAWSRNQYWASDSRQVDSQTVTDRAAYSLQEYYFFKYYKSGTGWMYSYADRTGGAGVSNVEFHQTWINTSGDSKTMVYNGLDDGIPRYVCDPPQVYQVEYWYKGAQVQNIPAETHTEWRCRDRQYLYRYHYTKWNDWSAWSTTPYTASDTRKVETRTVYRYKTDAIPSDEWTGKLRTISGKVSPTLAGKQALLVVYKHEEPSDFNNEYLGQTTIAEDGSYSFTFFTREEPSGETGDFIVKLGIEGANELLYLETIEAPKPEYMVTFKDWDGTVLSEQMVTEGNSAEVIGDPVREGYRFVGWNTGLTNVHDNLEVTPIYERKQCTVVFVDWSKETFLTQQYDVGADIIYPAWKEIEGYTFKGWFDENGNEVTKAEENLVLTASYEVKEFDVVFYDHKGEILSEQTVSYGQSALPPEVPQVEGQNFSSWSTYEYSSVKQDLNIYPTYKYDETTQNPKADIKACTLDKPIQVTLTCPDKDATIYYTLDGSKPDIFATEYTGPITIDKNVVLQFYARSENRNDSDIISEAYLMMNAEDDSGAIVIKKDKLSLLLGEDAPQITYFLYHENPDIGVEFYSLDDSIVSVDENGQLTVNNVGETKVFVVTEDYRYADYCDITVTSNEIAIETLDISQKSVNLFVGEEADLATKITPEDATYQDVVWSSADNSVVSIDQEGHLVAENAGGAYITAYSHSGKNVAYCYVRVEDTTLNLSEQEIVITMGQKYQLNARIPGDKQTLTWKSDNAEIASVSEDGLVTGIIPGTAVILVTAENGDFRTCTVRVTRGEAAAEPPEAPQIEEVTDTTIVVVKQEGCEYSLNGKNWQESNVFMGLTQDTEYVVYSRVKATAEMLASSASKGTIVRTAETRITIEDIPEQTYTGKKIQPEIVVSYKGELLEAGKDYTVSYKNNEKVSDTAPTVIVTGKNLYSGTISKNFAITCKDIGDGDITVSEMITTPNNKKQQLKPKVTYGKLTLKAGRDYTISYPDTEEGVYIDKGEWTVVITGIGNYKGVRTLTMNISDKTQVNKTKIKAPSAVFYDGTLQKPEVTVTYKGQELKKGIDYELSYPNTNEGAYILPGTYEVKVTGIGNFVGSKTVNFKINGIQINKASVSGIEDAVEYTGDEITQDTMEITLEGVGTLVKNRDYEIQYSKNVNAGKASVTIVGINGYAGTIRKTFKIVPYNLENDIAGLVTFAEEPQEVEFVKGGCMPDYEILFNGSELEKNKDFTVKYANNKAVNDGTDQKKVPTTTITGKGNFTGKIVKTFIINEQDIEKLKIYIPDVEYKANTKFYKAVPVVYDTDGKKLSAGKDYEKQYTYTYADGSRIAENEIPEAGSELRVTVKGKGSYTGTISEVYRVGESLINKAKIDKIKKSYTGDEITLTDSELTVKLGKETLVAGRDFVIVEDSYERNINPGTATVMIRGIGDYAGEAKVKFTIQKKRFF